MTQKKINYQEAMTELESIVKKLESDETSIDELNGLVTRALSLVKTCKEKLRETEGDLNQALEEQ